MAARIRKGDMVQVIAGNDGPSKGKPGKIGRVLSVDTKSGRVVVEGVNVVWKHVKPNQRNPQGGRIQMNASIHASNVMPVDPATGKGTRVRFVKQDDGKKHRIAATKKTGTDLGAIGGQRPTK